MTKPRPKYQRNAIPDKRLREPLYRTDSAPCGKCGEAVARQSQYTLRGESHQGKVYHSHCATLILEAIDAQESPRGGLEVEYTPKPDNLVVSRNGEKKLATKMAGELFHPAELSIAAIADCLAHYARKYGKPATHAAVNPANPLHIEGTATRRTTSVLPGYLWLGREKD